MSSARRSSLSRVVHGRMAIVRAEIDLHSVARGAGADREGRILRLGIRDSCRRSPCRNGSVWLLATLLFSFTSLRWLVDRCFVVQDALAASSGTPVGPALALDLGDPRTTRWRPRPRTQASMIGASAIAQTRASTWRASSRPSAARGWWLPSRHNGWHSLSPRQHRPTLQKGFHPMTRARTRWGAADIIGVLAQANARLGVADELDTGIVQRLPDPRAGMRFVAARADDRRLLPIG